MSYTLRADNISKRFGTEDAVKGVKLNIKKRRDCCDYRTFGIREKHIPKMHRWT